MQQKLKIGLLLNVTPLTLWEYKLIEKLNESKHLSIDYIIYQHSPSSTSKNWQYKLLSLYIKLDKKLFNVSPDASASIPKNTKELFQNIPSIDVTSIQTNLKNKFSEKDVVTIKNQNLDILIKFGVNDFIGEVLNASKYGIWGYFHGEYQIPFSAFEGFLELMNNKEFFQSNIEILSEEGQGNKVLSQTISKVDRLSLNRHKNNYYWTSLSLLPRTIERLHILGEKKFFKEIREKNLNTSSQNINSLRTNKFKNFQVFKYLSSHFIKVVKIKLEDKKYFPQWILLFQFQEESSFKFKDFIKIIPEKDKFYADPFPLYVDGKYYIFLEELPYHTEKGYLSVIEIDEKGNAQAPIKIIEEPYHLSYPNVIKENNTYYMIPESCANKSIDIYRCIKFPYQWEFYKNIMKDVIAVDTTMFFYHEKWWLFCNIQENEGSSNNNELFLFYADSIFSEHWISHPQNPIVSDVRKSRPAGKIFMKGDKIFRPSQNCKKWYGYGITLNEILTLNETEYKEQVLEEIEPYWEKNIMGVHTFNRANKLTVIDAILNRQK